MIIQCGKTMKFKRFTVILLVSILAASAWKLTRPQTPKTEAAVQSISTEQVAGSNSGSWSDSSEVGVGHSASSAMPEGLKPPSADRIRAEAAEDPHATPDSLLDFAEQLGARMEDALASREEAEDLFEELEDCVNTPEARTPPSVRALCLDNAQKLSETYPNAFSSRYSTMEGKVDPDARKLSAALKELE